VSCRFGYLWAVHSLYYWWRDQGLAEHGSLQSEHSPCYLNRMDPTEVAVGWGKYTLEVLRAFINRYTTAVLIPVTEHNCLVSDGLRARSGTLAFHFLSSDLLLLRSLDIAAPYVLRVYRHAGIRRSQRGRHSRW
jgi:hypothetical protein